MRMRIEALGRVAESRGTRGLLRGGTAQTELSGDAARPPNACPQGGI